MRSRVLHAYTWLLIAWLALPVGVLIVFGFNDTPGRYNQTWQGFTVKWYGRLFAYPDLTGALTLSLIVAVISSVGATVLGTGIGYALGRHRFRGAGAVNLLLFAAIAAPELILGASLLSLFVTLGIAPGPATVTVAHIMFSVAFVATVVRARVLTLDRSLSEAAADLGATPWSTFRTVTFPLLRPAILSGLLLAFALSIDDFVVTQFTAGTSVTFPLWIWGATRIGIPPQVNVMGTLIFAGGVLIALLSAARMGPRRGP